VSVQIIAEFLKSKGVPVDPTQIKQEAEEVLGS
jgi:hypothetical protein